MVNSEKYLTYMMQITSEITMENEEQLQCTEKGIYRGYFKNKHEQDISIVSTDVLHVPWLSVILLSIQSALQNMEFNLQQIRETYL
jgi:hypothetical protein